MNEMYDRRERIKTKETGLKKDIPGIEEIMDQGYMALGESKKHKSPVKRLIMHKNSTTKHKQRIYDGVSRGEYSQNYNIAPGQSYLIEP